MTTAYPYQIEGIDFLASRKAALLADDPGLGKTFQAIKACDKARALYVLIICPAGVVENWKREIKAHREGDWSAVVVSFEKAMGSGRAALIAREWCALIVDEAHYLKSISAKRTANIYGKRAEMRPKDYPVAGKAQQVWLLTGTPMPNNTSELYPHLRALAPETVSSEKTGLPWTLYQFQAAYCQMRNTGFGQTIVGSRNEEKLNGKLKSFMLRRRKADVLKDLPPMRFAELWLEGDVDGMELEDADAIREVLETEGVAGLRKLAFDGGVAKLRRLTGVAKALPAADWINTWLDSTPEDRKIVVFAHHHDVLDTLYDKLHTRAVQYHGHIKKDERQRAVDRMQNDPSVRVFIGQITAAGVGLTLTAASDLLFVESSWVPAENDQAAQRIHRIGQTEPCLVRYAMLAGSIDEDIQRACMRKMSSISKVVDGV